MSNREARVSHVSDTALMVAAARARETDRSDGLVHDPWAARLAGERGRALLEGSPRGAVLSFGVGMRSRFLDDLLLQLIGENLVDIVLLLGAGLDTRPWRLALPPALHWIEADFPAILDYKSALLTEAPHCRVERRPGDLTDAGVRKGVFAGAGPRTLLITEGLLMYLPADAVDAIAAEAAQAGVGYWAMDLVTRAFPARLAMRQDSAIENVRAESALEGDDILESLVRHGWHSMRQRSYVRDVMSIAAERVMAMTQVRADAGLPPMQPPPPDDPSGVHVFSRMAQP